MREKKTERERSTEDAASRRKNYGERAVGLFGRFFSRMRGGESSYVQDSPGDTGRFCGGGGGGEIQGPYFIHGGAVVVRGAEKKSEGTVRENSLFG